VSKLKIVEYYIKYYYIIIEYIEYYFAHEKDYVNKNRAEINLKTFSIKQVFQRKVKSSIRPRMSKNKVK
jgi:hypothetical protein